MDVDDDAKAGHPEGRPELLGVDCARLEDLVHMVDGVLDGGAGEEILLPEHMDNALCDGIAHGLDALFQSLNHLLVDVGCLDVPHEIVVGDGIEGLAADGDDGGSFSVLIEDKIREQRLAW